MAIELNTTIEMETIDLSPARELYQDLCDESQLSTADHDLDLDLSYPLTQSDHSRWYTPDPSSANCDCDCDCDWPLHRIVDSLTIEELAELNADLTQLQMNQSTTTTITDSDISEETTSQQSQTTATTDIDAPAPNALATVTDGHNTSHCMMTVVSDRIDTPTVGVAADADADANAAAAATPNQLQSLAATGPVTTEIISYSPMQLQQVSESTSQSDTIEHATMNQVTTPIESPKSIETNYPIHLFKLLYNSIPT